MDRRTDRSVGTFLEGRAQPDGLRRRAGPSGDKRHLGGADKTHNTDINEDIKTVCLESKTILTCHLTSSPPSLICPTDLSVCIIFRGGEINCPCCPSRTFVVPDR